ncbi:hypothetical protein M3Y94_00130400 [Aphelenchoides besseyi]|nr:hypothetical protein M3Y94_00130400 [Aphelenchoides besseyi]KAI6237346.1 hypothetical protein M3Y95_00255300 [Aphelenchoides besseyi]
MNWLWALLFFTTLVVANGRRSYDDIPESMLDANRSVIIDDERIYVPKKLPKLTREQKIELLRNAGITINIRRHKKKNKHRRALLQDRPWRIHHHPVITPPSKLIAADPPLCPKKFDAITEGRNRRTYIFSGELVYQIWLDNGLLQRAPYKIQDLFVGGPRHVSTAFTNLRSGITVLIDRRRVYRFRWNRKEKRFYVARNSPQELHKSVPFVPKLGFQWRDGNMVLSDGSQFVTYDPYHNIATSRKVLTVKDYFPSLPLDTIGLAHNGGSNFLLLTEHNGLEIYDVKKSKIVQEYPVSVNHYAACLSQL